MDMFAMDSVSELTAIETKELYQCIDSDEGVQALVRLMQGEQSIYLSCLCDGEDAMTADFVGLALSWSPSKAYYIPMPSSQGGRGYPLAIARRLAARSIHWQGST